MSRRPYDYGWGDWPPPAVRQLRYWLFLAGFAVVSFVLITLVLRARGL